MIGEIDIFSALVDYTLVGAGRAGMDDGSFLNSNS